MRFILLLGSLLISIVIANAQTTCTIKGKVVSTKNNEPVLFATVVVQNSTIGMRTDTNGNYILTNLPPGLYNLQVSAIGYKTKTQFEVQVTKAIPSIVNFELEENSQALKEVTVKVSPFKKNDESPVSLRTIGADEIQRNPGGGRDISKVIQSLPGVSSTASFRNDIIIRGGAPNENRFYLDGIEVPNINHFATQGSSGGPVGLINVDFIKEVDFYSGAFPAYAGNTLSSVFAFTQKDGRTDRWRFTGTIGASDYGFTADGPVSANSSLIFSVRRSYLQFLFKAIGLSFLPIYNDYQLKYKIKFDKKNELNIISLGALDNFALNTGDTNTIDKKIQLAELPVYYQWNYTFGLLYKHYNKNGYTTIVGSRNMLDNESHKYKNNDESNAGNLLLKYKSQEIENKLRIEHTNYHGTFKLTYGAGGEYDKYNNSTYNVTSVLQNGALIPFTINYYSALEFYKYNAFAQANKKLFNERLTLSLGVRADGNTYSAQFSNPLKTFSPRFSATYNITERLNINFNTGIYYQTPAYTVLGYRDSTGTLVNKANKVQPIQCAHIVAGIEYYTKTNTRFSIESFYKRYNNYPFLLREQISLANLGSDFGVIGNEPVTSTSLGHSYGIELLAQQKLFKGFYGIVSITLYRSQFQDKNGSYIPSAWDNRFILALTAGKKFKHNWELGAKFRIQGGAPYTPYDSAASSLRSSWDVNHGGVFNYALLNTKRLGVFNQLDVRLDKKYFFKHFNLDWYVDIQDIYNFQYQLQQQLYAQYNGSMPVVNPANTKYYKTYYVNNTAGSLLPTIGVIFEF